MILLFICSLLIRCSLVVVFCSFFVVCLIIIIWLLNDFAVVVVAC